MDTSEKTAVGRVAVRLRWDVLGVIALGGALGAGSRYAVGEALQDRSWSVPWATFVINVSGCLLMGALMVLVLQAWTSSRYLRPLVGVGVLGGFTTFSTYALETRNLLEAGRAATAGVYLGGSVAACLLALWVGALGGQALLAATVALDRRRRRSLGRGST